MNSEVMKTKTRHDHSSDAWPVEYQRLRAIAKHHRRGNGQGSAKLPFETAKAQLLSLVRRYQSRLEAVESLQRMALSPLAKLTEKLEPPEGYETVAVFDCGEVGFYYENENTGDTIEAPWPFDQSYIWPDDCESVGIRVE